MRERLTRNMGLKILSLLLAVLLWVVILNNADPVKNEIIKDIEISLINTKSIAEKDKVFEVVGGNKVDVKVRGKRSQIDALSNKSFKATADLDMLSFMNAVNIDIVIPNYPDVEIIDKTRDSLKVELENLIDSQFKVEVIDNGKVLDGYHIKERIAKPNIIKVKGAESVVNKIDRVVVEVDVDNVSRSFETKALPKVYDKNGTLIESNKLTLNYDEVLISVNLLPTKTVRLDLKLKGTLPAGYEYKDFDYEPKNVEIAGEKEELNNVYYISGIYDLGNVNEEDLKDVKEKDFEGEADIRDYITNFTNYKIILTEENPNVVIKYKIIKLESREISFLGDDIDILNVPPGLTVDYNLDALYNIKVFGSKEVLDRLNRYNIRPYIDLTDYVEGPNEIDVQFDMSDNLRTGSNPIMAIVLNQSRE